MVVVVQNHREQEDVIDVADSQDTKPNPDSQSQPTAAVVSTMCEYLRDLGSKGEPLAVPVPICGEDGRYAARQCNGGRCYCVDDFGVEMQGQPDLKNDTQSSMDSLTEADCRTLRSAKPCYNLLCRLGCDYGFEHDADGCPICACRNPCKNANCADDQICQLAEPDSSCSHRWCPPVPKCTFSRL